VRRIPIQWVDLDDRPPVLLPCPEIDLIRLASVIDCDHALESLLRRGPSLMLFALSSYHDRFEQPPESARQLVQWCQSNLVLVLLNSIAQPIGAAEVSEVTRVRKVARFFEDFLRIRNNQELRRSLRQFLIRFAGVTKQDGKQLVKRLVGKQLRADQFRCGGIRRKKTLGQVVSSWMNRGPGGIEVDLLLKAVSDRLNSRAEFEARLHDQKLAAMKQLAYGASHEINNPLANIATRAQTMLAVETQPEKRHKLSVIYEQAMRAHEMISDMMLFAHPPAIDIKRVSIRLLMSKIIRELNALLETTPSTSLEVTIGAGIDQVFLDETHIAVLIKNLIQNSVEAILSSDQRNGRILFRVDRTAENEFEFSIWDNGLGISDHIASHLFDPFFSGREAGRGLGFGLSKVWTIAKLHGGDVRLDRNQETGTRFVVWLPVDQTDVLDRVPELSILKKRLALEDEAA
jgi:signal transduction histidine kinase